MKSFLKQEWFAFWTAVMFFTRIPVPFHLPYSTNLMNQSQKYFSSIGLIVGGINVLFFYLFSFFFDLGLSLVLTMGLSVLLTGAFHEDGFADVCDSFGGGYSPEKILTIMKDSRLGAYGTIGMVLLLGAKFGALHTLGSLSVSHLIYAILFSHVVSRFVAGTMIYTHCYVADIDLSKSKPLANERLSYGALFFAFVPIGLFFFFVSFLFVFAVVTAYISKVVMGAYFKKHLGGYTGDCLGATQQVAELICYLTLIVIWNYI